MGKRTLGPDKMCISQISTRYCLDCSEECPCTGLCTLLAVERWLREVNKYYEKGE